MLRLIHSESGGKFNVKSILLAPMTCIQVPARKFPHASSPARKFPGSLMVARRNRGWVARKFSACQIGGGWHASSARKFSACQIGGGWHACSAHASSARKFICCLIPQRRLFFRGHLLRVALSNVFVRTTFTEKFGIYQSKRDCDSTCSHCC